MGYRLHGNLFGYICRDCFWPLWGIKVRIYAPEERELVQRVAADPRYTTAAVDEQSVGKRERRLLGEGEVSEDGAFEVALEGRGYQGGAVDVDIRVERLPQLEEVEIEPQQVHITTLQPQWRERGDQRLAYWPYHLPAGFWCRLLAKWDVWAICGRVTICDTDQEVSGVVVEARDVDWFQQDYLGSATTDASGRFVIYYPGKAFRKGAWIDIELTGGPDLYFTVKTPTGLTLLAEPPSRGRQPDRENVGNCFCVELCVKDVPTTTHEGLAVFTHVGKYIHATDIESAINQSGLTKPNSQNSNDVRAFFRTMRLNGQLPKKLNGHPLEYCFEWREVDQNGSEISPWTKVQPHQVAKTVIGNWSYYDGTIWHTRNYTVNGAAGELAASWTTDGYIQVPQESSVFSPTGFFQPNGNQINLISQLLVPWGSFDMTGKVAGATSAPFGKNRYFGLRMLARSGPSQTPQGTSAGELAKIAIENRGYDNLVHHPAWAGHSSPAGTVGVNLLDIEELKVNGCAEVKDTLTVLVTAAHPNLGKVSLTITGGNAQTLPAAFTVPTAGLPDEQFGTATNDFVVTDLAPCAYIVSLSTVIMLTTGDQNAGALTDQMAFCKAPDEE